ncbi:hypothetical protein SCARR_05265 [Pontiella sulfatireligans]|uniref:Uncharacterized protein n=1 Tax=Pontiella sulfatireligans TaxID=2750658 RepID=A0A6C2US43_9BACT|nr:hypothetical protein SCARR_05265 [Pontiella sulfatireligans]
MEDVVIYVYVVVHEQFRIMLSRALGFGREATNHPHPPTCLWAKCCSRQRRFSRLLLLLENLL